MKFIKRISLICFGLLMAFFCLEIAARNILPIPQSVKIENIDSSQTVDMKGDYVPVMNQAENGLYYSNDTGLRLKRNMRATLFQHNLSKETVEITTNSLGYRYPELGIKTPDEYRILTLGDSITLADYAKFEDTYTYHIEKNLMNNSNKGFPKKIYKVINAGVGTIGTENELAILQETGLKSNPDMILLALYLNDAQESLHLQIINPPKFSEKSYFVNYLYSLINKKRVDKLYRFVETNPTTEAVEFARSHNIEGGGWMEDTNGFNRYIYEQYHDWGYAWSPNFLTKIKQTITVMNNLAKEHKIKLAVVIFPVSYQIQSDIIRDEPQRELGKIFQNLQIPYLDLMPLLRDKYHQNVADIYYDWCHYKPVGNAFIGQQISRFLQKII